MASSWYLQGLADCLDDTIDITGDTLKIMLVSDSYTFNKNHTVIDNGANDGTDPSFCELSATNYTGGYGGGGRKTATVTRTVNTTAGRIEYAIDDVTWTSLGGASNDTIGGAILVKEITNDAASRLIAFFDVTDTTTPAQDTQLDFRTLANGGNLRISV